MVPAEGFGSMGDIWAASSTVHIVDGRMLGLDFSCFGSRGDALCSCVAGPCRHWGPREEQEVAPEVAACADGHTQCLKTQVRGSWDGPGRNTCLWRNKTPDLSPGHANKNFVIGSIQTALICKRKISYIGPDLLYQLIAAVSSWIPR